MRWQGGGSDCRAIEARNGIQSPAAAAVTVFQQQIEMAAARIVRRTEMLQQHVAQRMRTHGFPPAVTTLTLREDVSTVMDSAPSPADVPEQSPDLAHRFRDRFESLVPEIQQRWPEVTQQALEATRGSFDEVVQLLSKHSNRAGHVVSIQLEELLHQAGDRTKHLADSLDPLEEQLERLLDELNQTCLLYTSPSPRDLSTSRMPSSA